jgi:hypothetical protein
MTGKCLRQVEHIRGHLWHIYCIAINQVIVATASPSWLGIDTSNQDFLDRGLLLTRKLLHHGFLLVKLKSSLRRMVFFSLFYYKWINIYLKIFICNFKQLIKSLGFLTIPSEYIISLNKKSHVFLHASRIFIFSRGRLQTKLLLENKKL